MVGKLNKTETFRLAVRKFAQFNVNNLTKSTKVVLEVVLVNAEGQVLYDKFFLAFLFCVFAFFIFFVFHFFVYLLGWGFLSGGYI